MILLKYGFYYESIWLWNYFNWIYLLVIWWELCNYFIRLLKMLKIMVLLILLIFLLFFINKYKWYLLCFWMMFVVIILFFEILFWCLLLLLYEGEYFGGGFFFFMLLNEFLGILFIDIICSLRLKLILFN